jgi:hypothetical protein
MSVVLPIKVEVRGKASSSYDAETIDRRLAVLAGRTDPAAVDEIAFLEKVKAELAQREK